jgi:hypothetical protein
MRIQDDSTISSGGFRITIYPDKLTVIADRTAVMSRKKLAIGDFFKILIYISVTIYVFFIFIDATIKGGLTYLAILLLIIAASLLWSYQRGNSNIHCTCDNIEVIRVSMGRVRNQQLYPKDTVKGIRFAPVFYSKYGSICGLVFTVRGKKFKILYGLESPEAQIILEQLRRLGFDVIQDVGMPMMVEMALERRNSCLKTLV